jgi:hypothetical protein
VHDAFGNYVAIAEFPNQTSDELRFESNIWLDHAPSTVGLPDRAFRPDLSVLLRCRGDAGPDGSAHAAISRSDQSLHNWVSRFVRRDEPIETGKLLMTLTSAVRGLCL